MYTSLYDGLSDAKGRSINYLRVSLTDRCNYSCAYCRPADGWVASPKRSLLSLEEIHRFCAWMVDHGVRKIRLTGGEPLLRKGVLSLVESLRELPGLDELVMTTNGHLLPRFAADLRAAGLDRLNVSLDTINAEKFASLTGGGCANTVMKGIEAAVSAGFENTRVNAVLLPEVKSSERFALLDYCWSIGVMPTFIEMMPIGQLTYQADQGRLTTSMLMKELRTRHELSGIVREAEGLAGPARWYKVMSGQRKGKLVGTISPMTDNHFCETCNRARLTSTGGFRGCLGNDEEVQLLHYIRAKEKEVCLQRVNSALNQKRDGHLMGEIGFVPLSVMTGIGG